MTTVDLKNILIHRIAGINDKSVLTAINSMIDSSSKSIVYKTTPEQRKDIEEGSSQIAKGNYFSNDQVETEIDQWLKENNLVAKSKI
jgi:predicted transcriptional regulator